MSSSARRAAFAAALGALGLLVGGAVFLAAREQPTSPTTSSTTVASAAAGPDELAEAVAEGLQRDLQVAVTADEARCLAEGLIDVVPADLLLQLVERAEPLTGVPPGDRDALVRMVVGCLPERSAAAILGRATTTTALTGLPDEGQAP